MPPILSRLALALATLVAPAVAQSRPDGLYAAMYTSKGLIVARLETDLAPLAVANFVGLAEGTVTNAAFDLGHPFYDGSLYHRVVPGHVIQTGMAKSARGVNPGYTFPNEITARLSHNHAGAVQMANSGPNTNAAQFCVTLGDRGYLDGDYIVFGEVVDGMNVVMQIVQGDVLDSVRIVRLGAKAQAYHVAADAFKTMLDSAEARATAQAEKKKLAEAAWIKQNYPNATGPVDSVLTQRLAAGTGTATAAPRRVRYKGTRVRYMGHLLDYSGPPLDVSTFASDSSGAPGPNDPPRAFAFVPGTTKINPGLDSAIIHMTAGERRVVVVPAPLAYGRRGFYGPEIPRKRRFVISPNTLLVYEVEVLQPHP